MIILYLALYVIFVAIQAGLYCRIYALLFKATPFDVWNEDQKVLLFLFWPLFWGSLILAILVEFLVWLYDFAAGNEHAWFR